MMNSSVLLDTSYLISLVDSRRPYHANAKAFYQYFLDNKIHMILSSIATSEFCVVQPITDLPLSNFKMLAYNIPDSHHLRVLFMDYFHKSGMQSRIAVKDDYKLISQAEFNKIDFFITEDGELIDKVINPLQAKSMLTTKALFCPNGLQKEFNLPSPQANLFDGIPKEPLPIQAGN